MRPSPGSAETAALQGLIGNSLRNIFFRKSVAMSPKKNPVAGDMRMWMGMDPQGNQVAGTDAAQLVVQEYTGTRWSTVNKVVVGSIVAGIFLSMVGCRWLVSPETVITAEENELFPGPGELFAFNNDYLNQHGEDTWAAKQNVAFTTGSKFGSHAITCTDPTWNGVLTTNADALPKYPHAMSAWIYSGSAFAAMNWKMGWQFGWDGAATSYGSHVELQIDNAGRLRLYWHDDYDDTGDNEVITAFTGDGYLDAQTWYHFGMIWDYDNDEVIVVVNGEFQTVAIYDFNELGLRDSEQFRSSWLLDKDQDHRIDDLAVTKNYLIDPDIYVQHYNHDVAWSGDYNAKDVIIRPATGGKVMLANAIDIDGVLSAAEAGAGIVEQGSNANGEYVRFSNGTQICYRSNITGLHATTAASAFFGTGSGTSYWKDTTLTFAGAFKAGTIPSVAPISTSRATSYLTVTATTFKIRCENHVTTTSMIGSYIATGVWK